MAYGVKSSRSGTTYYLHRKTTATANGRRVLYFFSKDVKADAIDAVPEGYVVLESATTGMPLLAKRRD